MGITESKKQYLELFSEKEKAEAFDSIAEKFYFSNFGQTSKSDIETLMFSIYLERILNKTLYDMSSYSDYRLSKLLGITQSKVSNLKVKKELQYPYDKFDWREVLKRISEEAICEDNKIKLFIPDKNVYLEVKNAIEESGGFIEVQLTQNLLQVRQEFFLDLLIAVSDDKADKDAIKAKLIETLAQNSIDVDLSKRESIGQSLKRQAPELLVELLSECIPVFSGAAKVIGNNIVRSMRDRNR